MKKSEIQVGKSYRCKVSGNLVTVKILNVSPYGGWDALNTTTNRKIRIKSAQRLKGLAKEDPERNQLVEKVNNKLNGRLQASATKVGHVVVVALAGTGKTFTLIVGVAWVFLMSKGLWSKFLRAFVGKKNQKAGKQVLDPDKFSISPSEEQKDVWEALAESSDAKTVTYCAFNKSIVNEFSEDWDFLLPMLQRVGVTLQFATVNSLGYRACMNAYGRLRVTNYHTRNLLERVARLDIRELEEHDMVAVKATEKLVGLCKLTLAGWTEEQGFKPENVTEEVLDELVAHYDIDLNGHREKVYGWTVDILRESLRVETYKEIDFNDQNWLPVVCNLPVSQVDLLLVDESQDLNRCKQEFARKLGRRIVIVGDVNQCHPAGTLVRRSGGGTIPIEKVKVGHRVVSYSRNDSSFVGKTQRRYGKEVEAIGKRWYEGTMLQINGVQCTPNHKWLAKMANVSYDVTGLYLAEMKDGTYRIGMTQLKVKNGGFGPGMRGRQRKASKIWLLDVFPTREEAKEWEFKLSLKYCIPQLAYYEATDGKWARELAEEEGCPPKVEDLLKKYGRDYRYPIWTPADRRRKGERRGKHVGIMYPFVTEACNLISEIFLVCRHGKNPTWKPAKVLRRRNWEGYVYSLKVEPTQGTPLYIADNYVVHNSIYGFAGADVDSIPRMQRLLGRKCPTCGGSGEVSYPQADTRPYEKNKHCPDCHLHTVKPLHLTETRRCGKAIVERANATLQRCYQHRGEQPLEFTAHETNHDGAVRELSLDKYVEEVRDGDMVLCRVNAPLVSQALRLIKDGRKAVIRGRNFGEALINFIKKMKASDVSDLVEKVDKWYEAECQKEAKKKNPSEAKQIALEDRRTCIHAFCENAETVEQVVVNLNLVFAGKVCPKCGKHFDEEMDRCPVQSCKTERVAGSNWPVGPKLVTPKGVLFSSVHRAKGLESDRVYLLWKDAPVPHPMAKSRWSWGQELHIKYIMESRARLELVDVV